MTQVSPVWAVGGKDARWSTGNDELTLPALR